MLLNLCSNYVRIRPKQFYFAKSAKKVEAPKKLGQKNLVKIGSVTAEIFLILTNVARTNLARTNVTVTVGIC